MLRIRVTKFFVFIRGCWRLSGYINGYESTAGALLSSRSQLDEIKEIALTGMSREYRKGAIDAIDDYEELLGK